MLVSRRAPEKTFHDTSRSYATGDIATVRNSVSLCRSLETPSNVAAHTKTRQGNKVPCTSRPHPKSPCKNPSRPTQRLPNWFSRARRAPRTALPGARHAGDVGVMRTLQTLSLESETSGVMLCSPLSSDSWVKLRLGLQVLQPTVGDIQD